MNEPMLAPGSRVIRIREVTADDAQALHELYETSSEETRYKRFLHLAAASIPQEVRRLTRPASQDHCALLAEDRGEVIGAASYERLTGGDRADFAMLVGDRWQGHGVGTLLLERLCASARGRNIGELVGDVFAGNRGMLRLAANVNPGATIGYDGCLAQVRIGTRPAGSSGEAIGPRLRAHTGHPLRGSRRPPR